MRAGRPQGAGGGSEARGRVIVRGDGFRVQFSIHAKLSRISRPALGKSVAQSVDKMRLPLSIDTIYPQLLYLKNTPVLNDIFS